MDLLKAIIIEDEDHSLNLLKQLIGDYLPQIELLGFAKNVTDGIAIIKSKQPDLVFLDVDLGESTGFELLKAFDQVFFEVVFTTGHSSYAVEAFKHKAIHFIVKPVGPIELIEAVKRVTEVQTLKNKDVSEINSLLNSIELQKKKKLSIPISDGSKFITIADIVYIKADGSYSNIYMDDGTKLTVTKLLKELEKQLADESFYRVNKSCLVNLEQVAMLKRTDGGTIVMSDNSTVIVSRNKKDDFLIKISEYLT